MLWNNAQIHFIFINTEASLMSVLSPPEISSSSIKTLAVSTKGILVTLGIKKTITALKILAMTTKVW